jgi:AraC family transcriptional regulator of arabinose operon
MPDIQVLSASHMKHEPPSYHLVRAKGQNAINFVHFLTPIVIVCEGAELNMEKGSCIVYTPGVRQEYYSTPSGMINNFVTFSVNGTQAFLARYRFPLNEPFYIRDDSHINRLVDSIAWAAANRLERLEAQLNEWVPELCAMLDENFTIPGPKSHRDTQTLQRFTILRGEMRINPAKWTVEKMASAVWLTRSRFSVVYKEYFGVSPSADLEDALFDYAREKLLKTADSVSNIAADCGYNHAESFIRAFNLREGVTPGQFRKKKKEGG